MVALTNVDLYDCMIFMAMHYQKILESREVGVHVIEADSHNPHPFRYFAYLVAGLKCTLLFIFAYENVT